MKMTSQTQIPLMSSARDTSPHVSRASCLAVLVAALTVLSLAGCNPRRYTDSLPYKPHWPMVSPYPTVTENGCHLEPPFFGYHATCWRRWPDGWVGCPEQEVIEPAPAAAEPVPAGEAAPMPPMTEGPMTPSLPMPAAPETEPMPKAPGTEPMPKANEPPATKPPMTESPIPPPPMPKVEAPAADKPPVPPAPSSPATSPPKSDQSSTRRKRLTPAPVIRSASSRQPAAHLNRTSGLTPTLDREFATRTEEIIEARNASGSRYATHAKPAALEKLEAARPIPTDAPNSSGLADWVQYDSRWVPSPDAVHKVYETTTRRW